MKQPRPQLKRECAAGTAALANSSKEQCCDDRRCVGQGHERRDNAIDCTLAVRAKRRNVQPSAGSEPTIGHNSEPEARLSSLFRHHQQPRMVADPGNLGSMMNRERRMETAHQS